jgi:23S rRNA U2552 (ribose-2'-O)-methylase RlmE/FtsJ
MRSIGLIEKTLRIYPQRMMNFCHQSIYVTMIEELVRELKGMYGNANIVMFKPKSCRKHSKETYIIKRY